MVGIFKLWSVSGITTEGAKLSEPFNILGKCLNDENYYDSLSRGDKTNIIALGKELIVMHEQFCKYYETGSKKLHDDAVKFLVMVGAVALGEMGIEWDWKGVREYSQGFYQTMIDERYSFEVVNLPHFEKILADTESFIEGCVK